jgi:ubiquinone/menaquinone biosynthesis C-methylase UbiE
MLRTCFDRGPITQVAKIHKANVEVHRLEARNYELIHSEIYNHKEQKRLRSMLRTIDTIIEGEQRKTLDFGAGTGNVTSKLLQMQYCVTAVDISPEMCNILAQKYRHYLRTGMLKVINSTIEDAELGKEQFDLITCYSVLHHLPDYLSVIEMLCAFLKKGGVMYLDHEGPPFHQSERANHSSRMAKYAYVHYRWFTDQLYFRIRRLNLPSLDYSLVDCWSHLDHEKIEATFRKLNFSFFTRIDYHLKQGWLPNPFFGQYERTCKPDRSLWIAQK